MNNSFLHAFRVRLRALASVGRLSMFLSAGVAGLVVDNIVLAVLVELGGLSPVFAKLFSWEAAVIIIFLINERWTFSEWGARGLPALLSRFLRSNLIRVGGLLVTLLVLYVLTEWFGVWYLLANIVGIGVGFVVNYTFESLLTWRVHRSG